MKIPFSGITWLLNWKYVPKRQALLHHIIIDYQIPQIMFLLRDYTGMGISCTAYHRLSTSIPINNPVHLWLSHHASRVINSTQSCDHTALTIYLLLKICALTILHECIKNIAKTTPFWSMTSSRRLRTYSDRDSRTDSRYSTDIIVNNWCYPANNDCCSTL